jgi:hypothetical protein
LVGRARAGRGGAAIGNRPRHPAAPRAAASTRPTNECRRPFPLIVARICSFPRAPAVPRSRPPRPDPQLGRTDQGTAHRYGRGRPSRTHLTVRQYGLANCQGAVDPLLPRSVLATTRRLAILAATTGEEPDENKRTRLHLKSGRSGAEECTWSLYRSPALLTKLRTTAVRCHSPRSHPASQSTMTGKLEGLHRALEDRRLKAQEHRLTRMTSPSCVTDSAFGMAVGSNAGICSWLICGSTVATSRQFWRIVNYRVSALSHWLGGRRV